MAPEGAVPEEVADSHPAAPEVPEDFLPLPAEAGEAVIIRVAETVSVRATEVDLEVAPDRLWGAAPVLLVTDHPWVVDSVRVRPDVQFMYPDRGTASLRVADV